MTNDTVHDDAVSLVRRSCAAQGLTEKISDPTTIARIVALLRNDESGPTKAAHVNRFTSARRQSEGDRRVQSI